MFDFVAILADPQDPNGQAANRSLAAHLAGFETSGLLTADGALGLSIWTKASGGSALRRVDLPAGSGFLLGQVFRSGDPEHSAQIGALGPAEANALRTSRGHSLFSRYWGRYLAFVAGSDGRSVHAVRDPTGALPCFQTSIGGARILFSDLGLLLGWSQFSAEVNLDYLALNALAPQFQKSITGLQGVSEVLPGQILTVSRDGAASELGWNPYELAGDEHLLDPGRASALLRETVLKATHCLANPQRSPLVSVGGLDSSIILACLARSACGQRLHAVNFSTTTPKGDERRYGQAAADFAGVDFTHRPLDPARVDLSKMVGIVPQVNPMPMFDCTSPAGGVYELADELGADSLFYGVGGDNIFFQLPHILSALDYARTGIGTSNLPRVIFDAARYGRTTVWKTIGAMIRERLRPSDPFDLVTKLVAPSNRWPYLGEALLDRGPRLDQLHPLLLPDRDVPPGKCAHILSSAFLSIPYYDHWRPQYRIERICPLLSQPVIELCLRIPTWNFTRSGVDRALARHAFRNMLAPEVLHRTSKSTPDDLYEGVLARNLPFLREVLLDGELVRCGVLARAPLEELLRDMAPRAIGPGIPLEFFSWETWVQSTKAKNSLSLLN